MQDLKHLEFSNLEELRALIQEGLDSGNAEPFTLEELLAEARARFKQSVNTPEKSVAT